MDSTTKRYLDNLRSEEREVQNQAFFYIRKATGEDPQYRKKYASVWK